MRCEKVADGAYATRLRENVRQPALQPLQNLLQPAQRETLLPAFEPVEGGSGNAQFSCEPGVSQVAALLPQEQSELSVQGILHALETAESSILYAE